MASERYIGTRLSYSGALCTIHYIGRVSGTKGEWLGVEWDDPENGKHSGEHQGVKYFECRSKTLTAASFIRPIRPFDQPLSFLEALRSKYASDASTAQLSNGHTKLDEQVIEISGKIVQEVGFEKIRKQLAELQELRIVLLDGLCIAGLRAQPWSRSSDDQEWLDELGHITKTCPRITELDLSRNLLENWIDVVGICRALPDLRVLKLNGLRFKDLTTSRLSIAYLKETFQGIRDLSLDDTLLSWEEITTITSTFPTLQTLSFASNSISTTPTPLSTPHITTLSLSANDLTTLSTLSPLFTLPLHSLTLRSNAIALSSPTAPLLSPTLNHLDLTSNLVSTFATLSVLPQIFPNLNSLLLSKNPLYDSLRTEEAFLQTLARIPSLTTLNYSKIRPAERTNAELYYLAQIGRELGARPPDEEELLLKDHPRWAELCERYGAPIIKREEKRHSDAETTLGARLVTLRLRMPRDDGAEVVEKELMVPKTVSIYRLKSLVGPLFGLRPMWVRLVVEGGEEEFVREESGDEEEEGGDRVEVRGRWVQRDVEMVDSTKEVGTWVESGIARVRVEKRGRWPYKSGRDN